MYKYIFYSVLAVLMVICCTPSDVLYSEKKTIPNGGWMWKDTFNYTFSITDTAARYNLYVDLEHVDTFPAQNIYIKLYTLLPDGKRLSKPCSFDLFNKKGESNGSCSGQDCTLQTVLQDSVMFNQPGQYTITMEQFMRQNPVYGIHSVGFSVVKAR